MGTGSYKRIIYFHNGSLGDFLMTLHLCENLRAAFPDTKIVVTVPRYEAVCRELAAGYPYVAVLPLNRRNALFRIARLFGGRNCAITPPTPGRIPLATKIYARVLAGFFGTVVGFDDGAGMNRFLFSKTLPYDTKKLYVLTMHDILRALGVPVSTPELSFCFTRDADALSRLNLSKRRYIAFHPFGSSRERSMMTENVVWLVRKLRNAFPEYAVLVTGSADDYARYQMTLDELVRKDPDIIVPHPLSMREMATALCGAALYVGVDTGITHLASILRVPSVVIAHTATPGNWLPYYNENATILYHIQGDTREVYEGREYLFKNEYKVRCLEMPPREVIYGKIATYLIDTLQK